MVVISKAEDLASAGKLVFGLTASGKTSFVINDLKGQKKVLWLYTNNTNSLTGNPVAKSWQVAEIGDFSDIQEIIRMLKAGELERPDVIVLEGLEGLRDFALDDSFSKSTKDFVMQNDWGNAGRELSAIIRKLRDLGGVVYGTVDVIEDEELSRWKLALNADVERRVFNHFGEKVHTYTRAGKTEDNLQITYHHCVGQEAVKLVNLPKLNKKVRTNETNN